MLLIYDQMKNIELKIKKLKKDWTYFGFGSFEENVLFGHVRSVPTHDDVKLFVQM